MLKKSITYETFDGETVTEDFYFHLSKADLIEMEAETPGGLAAHLQKIVASEDGAEIIKQFKKFVLGSYGKKSSDGKRFIRSKELREEFETSPAYDVLFTEIVTNAQAAADFVNGIIPPGLDKIAPQDSAPDAPMMPTEPKVLTAVEIREMDADELKAGIATGRYKLS